MFGFSKQNNKCPIENHMRLWMENSFLWLANQFGEESILSKRILVPNHNCFPIVYDGSRESIMKTAEIVASQMDVDLDEVNLLTYDENIRSYEGGMGHRIFTEIDRDSEEKLSAGLYFGRNKDNKYDVFIEERNLLDPQTLVATIAHEFAHIKILGEGRLDFNDENLTDLTTVVFGLGIFNANSSFKFNKGFDGWSHNSIGYLKQQEWGYALALYAYYREEKSPDWIKYLTKNIQSDFRKGESFIYKNSDKVFKEEYKG